MRSEEGRYEVQSWEKIKTPKGEFNAFKLVMIMSVTKGRTPELRTTTYYYAPDIKAIISYNEAGTEVSLTSTLIDYNLSK